MQIHTRSITSNEQQLTCVQKHATTFFWAHADQCVCVDSIFGKPIYFSSFFSLFILLFLFPIAYYDLSLTILLLLVSCSASYSQRARISSHRISWLGSALITNRYQRFVKQINFIDRLCIK